MTTPTFVSAGSLLRWLPLVPWACALHGTAACDVESVPDARHGRGAAPTPAAPSAAAASAAAAASVDAAADAAPGVDAASSFGASADATTAHVGSSGNGAPALPSVFASLDSPGNWGIDAPNDGDQQQWLNSGLSFGGSNGTRGYGQKGFGAFAGIAQLPTITNSNGQGGTRFGPVIVDGVNAIFENIQEGDALYWQGNRSGFGYDGYRIAHGQEHWFALAFKFGTEWVHANAASGATDQQCVWDTHSVAVSPGFDGTTASLQWSSGNAGRYTGKEMWFSVARYDGSGPAFLYNFAATPGAWQRVILRYRSGAAAQGPLFDVWLANGTGAFAQLPKVVDPYTGEVWTSTPAFGDPLGNTLPQHDYPKQEIYKWTSHAYGSIPNRSLWVSELFASPGANLYDNAVTALAPYAR